MKSFIINSIKQGPLTVYLTALSIAVLSPTGCSKDKKVLKKPAAEVVTDTTKTAPDTLSVIIEDTISSRDSVVLVLDSNPGKVDYSRAIDIKVRKPSSLTGKILSKGKTLKNIEPMAHLQDYEPLPNVSLFKESRFSYSYPDSIELSDKFVFKMAISRSLDTSDLVEIVLDNLPRSWTSGSVKASDIVEVKLVGDPKVFNITPISSEGQSLSSSEVVKWSWLVSPLESGTHKLFVSIRANIRVSGQSIMQTIDSHEAAIQIYVKKRDIIKGFFLNNWSWLFGSLIIPLVVFFYKRKKDGKD